MKLLIIDNGSNSTYRFRLPLIRYFISRNIDVYVTCGDDSYINQIKSQGANFIESFAVISRSTSIINATKYYRSLLKILRSHHFDCVLTFQLKPNIFGSLAARKLHVNNIYSVVEGLGDPFIKKGAKWALIRSILIPLLKVSFKKNKKVIFLNKESLQIYLSNKIINESQGAIINGMGIDTEKYQYSKIDNYNNLIMCSRLIKSKGVLEYCESAVLARKVNPNLRFFLFGKEDEIKRTDIQKYIDSNDIIYGGFIDDVLSKMKNCGCFVLPTTYFEGVPMSIMEAMATGRPVITTNSPGCNVVVTDNVDGLFISKNDSFDLASKILFLTKNHRLMDEMGRNGRTKMENSFNCDIISSKFYNLIIGDKK
jgi:glycosyltransferase involved in cell wall biosynthesis